MFRAELIKFIFLLQFVSLTSMLLLLSFAYWYFILQKWNSVIQFNFFNVKFIGHNFRIPNHCQISNCSWLKLSWWLNSIKFSQARRHISAWKEPDVLESLSASIIKEIMWILLTVVIVTVDLWTVMFSCNTLCFTSTLISYVQEECKLLHNV